MEGTEIDWAASASGQGQVGIDVDRISYLSGAYVMGSRRVGDHILEPEEHCQEQEDSVPMSSTTKVHVVGELDCSPGRSETRSATWVGTGEKVQQLKTMMHPQHSAKIHDQAQGPRSSNHPLNSFTAFTKRIKCTI